MSDNEEKKHDASRQKLVKQRNDGSIPQTSDASSLYGTAAGISVLAGMGYTLFASIASNVSSALNYFSLDFAAATEVALVDFVQTIVRVLLPIACSVLFVSVGLTLIMNKGPVFAIKPVLPDLQRVSMTSGFKRIYGMRGQKEVMLAFIRLVIWLISASIAAALFLPEIFRSVMCDAGCLVSQSLPLFRWMFFATVFLFIVSASFSVFIQRKIFLKEQRMTDTERKNERKDQNGSAAVAKERNNLRQKLHLTGGGAKIPLADTTVAIISNEGIIGIAYEPPKYNLPMISVRRHSASDANEMSGRLAKLGVIVVEDEALVNGCKGVAVGDMIPSKMFPVFAQVALKASNMAQEML